MSSEVTAERVRPWLTELPLPGSGATRERLRTLERLGALDLALAKVVEPHHDAVAILHDLRARGPEPDSIWAVWAAEPPFAVLKASPSAGGVRLTGRKAFCSGWGVSTHALVTASLDGSPSLFAVDLAAGRIAVDAQSPAWEGPGMRRARTETLVFDDVPAEPVGVGGAYTARPGFWHGAIGVAAIWAGGTRGVAQTLEQAADRLDPHGLAHLGAVRALLAADEAMLDRAANLIDRDPTAQARRMTEETRAVIAEHATRTIDRVGRALGPGPLATQADHATRVADLTVFVRQHHGERDLAALGTLT